MWPSCTTSLERFNVKTTSQSCPSTMGPYSTQMESQYMVKHSLLRWIHICLRLSDEWARLYLRRGERFSDACVLETDRFSGGSVMKWGGRSHVERIDLKLLTVIWTQHVTDMKLLLLLYCLFYVGIVLVTSFNMIMLAVM